MNGLQKTVWFVAGLALWAHNASAGLFGGNKSAKPQAALSAAQFEKEVKPLLNQYCIGCHGEKKKADLDLRIYTDIAAVEKDRKTWEKVMTVLMRREMPPEKKPQPSDAERGKLVTWVQNELFQCDCDRPDPGRVTIRRLNRTEYNNTVRDLLGVTFRPADDFPADDVGYGFDNIGDVLSMPPILIEKYFKAAGQVLDKAIISESPTMLKTNHYTPEHLERTSVSDMADGFLRLHKEGDAYVNFLAKAEGDYVIRVLAYGEQAGPDPARMGFKVDKLQVKKFDVTHVKAAPGTFEYRTHLKPGSYKLAASYLNNYVNEKAADPKDRDRNLVVGWLEVEGPYNAVPVPLPDSHLRIFAKSPAKGTTNEVAREIISKFATRAFRRPVTKDELDRLTRITQMVLKDSGNFEKAIKLSFQAVLVSPHFLFRGELQPNPDNPKKKQKVSEYALATRLSYFLWSSTPDDELLALAEKGKLRKNVDAQVQRMLKDPKARALVDNFVSQWLELRKLEQFAPDEELFPEFDNQLKAAMMKETELYFENIVKEDRSILELVDSDYTFVNERLAKHYGIAGVKGDQFQKVSVAGTPRGGVLTQASIMALTSNPTRTSPVKRGKWVLDNILGTPPPPPPPNVPPLKEGAQLVGTLRERMEQHRSDALCSSCHARMDPIGFGFENFDAIGGFRSKDGDSAIETAGKLVSGETFKSANDFKALLLKQKRDEFVHCMTEKMLTYALGRGLEYYDKCAVDDAMKQLGRDNYRFSSLIHQIVNSVPFQERRGEGDRMTSN